MSITSVIKTTAFNHRNCRIIRNVRISWVIAGIFIIIRKVSHGIRTGRRTGCSRLVFYKTVVDILLRNSVNRRVRKHCSGNKIGNIGLSVFVRPSCIIDRGRQRTRTRKGTGIFLHDNIVKGGRARIGYGIGICDDISRISTIAAIVQYAGLDQCDLCITNIFQASFGRSSAYRIIRFIQATVKTGIFIPQEVDHLIVR